MHKTAASGTPEHELPVGHSRCLTACRERIALRMLIIGALVGAPIQAAWAAEFSSSDAAGAVSREAPHSGGADDQNGAELRLARVARTSPVEGASVKSRSHPALDPATVPEPARRAGGPALEEITVTATRIQRPGFKAPTPTIVLMKQDIEIAGHTDIGSVINDLPVARATFSSIETQSNPSQAATSTADLRGLGPSNTLVLVDGHRPVPFDAFGEVDLNAIPLGLVKRIDVVTGGASAAYGSDAVGGVINIILDNKLDGLRLNAQYGNTTDLAGSEYYVSMSYGVSFAENRAHVIFGGNHGDTKAIGPQARYSSDNWNIMPNLNWTPTNGEPMAILAPDVNFATVSTGGLIVGCGTASSPVQPPGNDCGGLLNQTFEPNGAHRPFVLGNYYNGFEMSGGDPQAVGTANFLNARPPLVRNNAFGRFAYDISDNLRFKTDVFYSRTESNAGIFPPILGLDPTSLLVISSDNAYIPGDVRGAMASNGFTSLQMGRVDSDWGLSRDDIVINNFQGVAGLEGDFGGSWTWDAFYSYGESLLNAAYSNIPVASRLAASLDSILSNGQPECRDLAANPGCVPLNVFGYGNASPAALSYILGTATDHTTVAQQEASATVHGTPLSDWAGPVSIATGAEWRHLGLRTHADPSSLEGEFVASDSPNFGDVAGKQEVYEGFVESVIPLLNNIPLIKSLEFNGAVRGTYYEHTGFMTSWKLGVNYYITGGVRLRYTDSQDIRAPNINELYQAATVSVGPIIDPATDMPALVVVRGGGNPNLGPQTARTTTVGAVYQPGWAPGLDLSLDFFRIRIKHAIIGLTAQDIVNRCYGGQTALCARISYDSSGNITTISSTLMNLAAQVDSGADFEGAYTFDLTHLWHPLKGQLSSRLFVSWLDQQRMSDGEVVQNNAGVSGPAGTPHWRGRLDERFQLSDFSLTARVRYEGGGDFFHGLTVEPGHVAGRTYLDVGAAYQLSSISDLTVYADVNNVLNRDAPIDPEPALFDTLGRLFDIGIRMKF